MAIKVKVRNNKQIIVPLRFGRAVTGDPVKDAPDVDDRGFAMGNRPGTWGHTDARGAMVGITAGDTVRLKVLREDIDASVQLFVTSSDTNVVTVESPQGALADDGIFSIKGLIDVISVPVKIQVHLGSATGPVLAEMEPHIFQLRQLNIAAHLVTINGSGGDGTTQTTRTADSLTQIFNDVNIIWRAAGIEFVYNAADIDSAATTTLATAGTVTTHLATGDGAEFDKVLNINRDAHRINVYFVHTTSDGWAGLTNAPGSAAPSGCALVDGVGAFPNLSDQASSHALAHELGHFLNLDHYDENTPGHVFRDDICSRRHLMYTAIFLSATAGKTYNADVGYGDGNAGALIDLKDFTGDPSDGELPTSRRASLALV